MEQMRKHNAPFPQGSKLQKYFDTLPKAVQEHLVQSGAPVTTVEQLKACVEQLTSKEDK
jgi:hypothetical protein